MQDFINGFFSFKFLPSLIIGALAFSMYAPRRRFFCFAVYFLFLCYVGAVRFLVEICALFGNGQFT